MTEREVASVKRDDTGAGLYAQPGPAAASGAEAVAPVLDMGSRAGETGIPVSEG